MSNVLNYFETPQEGQDNTLVLNGTWEINDVAVTATAAELNAAGDLAPTSSAAYSNTWGTAFSPAVSAALRYSQVGNSVTLYIPAISGTTSAAAKIVSVTALPAAIRPAAAQNVVVIVDDGTNVVLAKATIGTNGIITIGSDLEQANFANTTAVAVIATTVSYEII